MKEIFQEYGGILITVVAILAVIVVITAVIGKDENGVMEEILMVEWNWGYFSRKDGEKHSFCLCEKCYDRLRASFLLPVQVENYL